ncbi:antibiotic biosynthesis monooxygenase [Nodosilinea sp. LEGE 07088]|uniref:antibiotic biosynthesis monooxygenase n=1 Tax=Nodosilinea sp. LEGE 07088 TaxID=2777968 RepID=UPI00187FEB5A|nr:antibiotic biosynthesis monooxygenase [Nodosilinea sp. LEGE 07088]MBE9136146.1 antibiotic biosynthesis monooxygenase [Nodosilinea sp. LEGE 07088]
MGSPAGADKLAEPIRFDDTDGAIAVISLYKTTPTTQAAGIKAFYKTAKSFYQTIPGFYGLALFSSLDGARVVELSQWQDQASYEAFQASLTSGGEEDYPKYYEKYTSSKGKKKDQDGAGLGDPVLTASFAVEQIASPPGMVSAIPATMALVQISDIVADTVEHQANLVVAAQATLDQLPQLYPSPRTVVVLSGLDTPHVMLLANWGSTAEFGEVNQVPQLAIATTVATAEDGLEEFVPATDSHLYQTVKVITPKTKSYGK